VSGVPAPAPPTAGARLERGRAAEAAPEAGAKAAAAPASDEAGLPATTASAAVQSAPAAPGAILPAVAVERPAPARGGRAAGAVDEAPRLEAVTAEPRVREAAAAGPAPAAAPAGGDGVQGFTVREAAAPGWSLSATDAGQGPARPAPAAPHAPIQAQPPAQAASPSAVAGQVAVAIGRASDDKVEIRLDPPELGRVQIQLTRHDGGVQAVVLADRPETQDLLRRHAEVLVRELGEAGYGSVSLDFAGGEARAGREDARSFEWAEAAPGEPVAVAAAPAAAPRRSAAGGLDVRL
jgi:flagellar hook-length control protein FliK